MVDRLTSMAVFVRVVETGSFATAAVDFDISPAMVGKHVRILEEGLGVSLLARTTRKQSLTEAGRFFLERARVILAELESAENFADKARGVPIGKLRVTAPVAFGSEVLAPTLAIFAGLYPKISIDLVLSDRNVDLTEEGFDAAFRLGPLSNSDLIARPLSPYRFITCAAPSYLAKSGIPLEPEELANHVCLEFAHWGGSGGWRFRHIDGRERLIASSGRIRMNSYSALRAAAIAGAGIILQSQSAVVSAIEDGKLVPVLPEWESPSRPFYLIWLRDHRPTRKLRAFLDFSVARFGKSGANDDISMTWSRS